jgi:type I restriction enzyme, S subunit
VTNKLPNGWGWCALNEIVGPPQYGLSISASSDGNTPVIGMGDIVDGKVVDSGWSRVLLDPKERNNFRLSEGDLLLNRTNSPALVGKLAVWDRLEEAVFASYIVRYPARPQISYPQFTLAALSTSRSQQQIQRLVTRAISQANINPSAFYNDVEIALPPLPEQRRIVAVLKAWDQAIDQTERLIAAKRRRFDAARIRLIETFQSVGKGNNSWATTEFDEIAEEIKQRNIAGHGPDRVMGVIKGEGLVAMRSHVMAADLRRYQIVPPRAIAYNPMRLNIGSIAASQYDQDVLVSPDYVVFRARKGRADPDFLRFLIGTKRWRDHLIIVGSGSVRTRIYFDGLAEMVLRVPDIREQKRIGQFLAAIEQDLNATIESASALRTQKRGLMQKLLTGEWRLGENFE